MYLYIYILSGVVVLEMVKKNLYTVWHNISISLSLSLQLYIFEYIM